MGEHHFILPVSEVTLMWSLCSHLNIVQFFISEKDWSPNIASNNGGAPFTMLLLMLTRT